jgi:acetyl coenzyme A synthetase (ADP forming)-like protein
MATREGPTVAARPARPAGYRAELESEVLLADGRVAVLRPILPADLVLLQAFHESLSDETIYLRFFSPRRELRLADAEHFVNVDYVDRLALVAFVDDQLVAVGRYDRPPGDAEAEVAFVVREDQQGRGIATVLLEHLASAGRAVGVRRFVADTLAQNRRMLSVFAHAGFEEYAKLDVGVVRVTMELAGAQSYEDQVEERDRHAAVASIARLLRPSSIAVVGASRRPGTIGRELLGNLISGGFRGPIYPVNRAGGEIDGLEAYRSVSDLPAAVDLAVIAVPAAQVLTVVEQCGRKGVGGLVVISAGFAETGEAGRVAERELVSAARRHGMRLVGPNCMGVVNTAADVSMNATFSPAPPVRGTLAFSSQSGGLGIAILAEATRRELGLSSFVSVGNKADVSGNDLLRYWDEDAATDVILLYLESFGNPRHFSRIARGIARNKPIIAVKSGRSTSGSRGAASHTAAMATPDATVDALFRQAGVIRVDTLEELFDVADVLSHQPLPMGNRVAILGNAGGPGVLAADACESHGLVVPELSETTKARLRSVLSPDAGVGNPIDCIASATAEQYGQALEIVLADEAIDAVIVIFTPPLVTQADAVASAIASIAAVATKPIVGNFLATPETQRALIEGERRIPFFAYPESAARALAKIAPYAAWRRKPEPAPAVLPGIESDRARAVVETALGVAGSGWLSAEHAHGLLGAYGIPVVTSVRASSVDEAVRVAGEIGYPVALKLDDPRVVHKTDVGGVRLGLSSQEQVEAATDDLLSRFGEGAGVLLQPMVPPGVETLVGVLEDSSFGPLVLFGLGGTATEVVADRALSLVPIYRPEAVELISSLRSSVLLTGYRGSPSADIGALADLICRVARLAEDLPEVVEMDLNPVVAGPEGCLALDCKIRVAAVSAYDPVLRRRHLR